MAQCGSWPVGVCSWSLRADISAVAKTMKELGITYAHLAVRQACGRNGSVYLSQVRGQSWNISSTMIDFPQEDYSTLETIKLTGGIAPDDCWEHNRRLFGEAVRVTRELGVEYLSMHAGFIEVSQTAYATKLRDRMRHLADIGGEKEIMLLMETGQENADELRTFLEQLNHPAVGVNFDPANMILYDRDNPIEAVRILRPWIKHVHIKDAIRTRQPGVWGTEVPWGEGEVGAQRFLTALDEVGFEGVLAVERESGEDRFGDIELAVERLKSFEM